jgi:hypothetical protein
VTHKNDTSESLRCPQCGHLVEVPEAIAAGGESGCAAFLQEEGNTCLALTDSVARLHSHEVAMTQAAIGMGIGGEPPGMFEYFVERRREMEQLEREVAALRVRLHHFPKP